MKNKLEEIRTRLENATEIAMDPNGQQYIVGLEPALVDLETGNAIWRKPRDRSEADKILYNYAYCDIAYLLERCKFLETALYKAADNFDDLRRAGPHMDFKGEGTKKVLRDFAEACRQALEDPDDNK